MKIKNKIKELCRLQINSYIAQQPFYKKKINNLLFFMQIFICKTQHSLNKKITIFLPNTLFYILKTMFLYKCIFLITILQLIIRK